MQIIKNLLGMLGYVVAYILGYLVCFVPAFLLPSESLAQRIAAGIGGILGLFSRGKL